MDIRNKVALITGASRRIGATVAKQLHQQGMRLCLHYRSSKTEAEALASELNALRTDSVCLVQMDMLQTQKLPELINKTLDCYGQLDLLVNNASSFYPTPADEFTLDDWDTLVGSNLKAPLFLSKAAIPALRKSQGCIINMLDIHAERPMPGHVVYSIAKTGLWAMTRSLAKELGPEIRVNGVAPGAILWPENDADDEARQAILERTALKRVGSPEDIAKAILFLFRDAPYVTGHMLPVDGGRLLNI